MKIEKKILDGKVAVLVSRGFGGGWSTWNQEYKEFFAMDKRLVEAKLQGKEAYEVVDLISEILGHDGCFVSSTAWDDIRVHWLSPGQKFRIDEYDGYESLVLLSLSEYMTA